MKKARHTGQMPRLIRVFAGRTCHFVGFVMRFFIFYFFCTEEQELEVVGWGIKQQEEMTGSEMAAEMQELVVVEEVLRHVEQTAGPSGSLNVVPCSNILIHPEVIIEVCISVLVEIIDAQHTKRPICNLQTMQAQISLRISAG